MKSPTLLAIGSFFTPLKEGGKILTLTFIFLLDLAKYIEYMMIVVFLVDLAGRFR